VENVSSGAVVLAGGNRIRGAKTCSNITPPNSRLTSTELGSNPDLCGESPATDRVSHGEG
jgi:hypothetical protein